MRQGHKAQARRLGQPPGGKLVGRVQVGMQEGDGDRGEALAGGARESGGKGWLVQRPDHLALGVQAFVGLDHAGVQRLGLPDIQREQVRPRLVADQEGVGESAGGHQQGARALALQEGVGGDRGAHLDGGDPVGGERRSGPGAQQPAHGLDRGVLIGRRGREQLGGPQLAGL